MRSYGQYCPLARALDVVGDRWTLLVVRELFARDSRYSDLKDALPGIATNLLADRLRQLQAHGLVEQYEAPPPVRSAVYRLTPRGRELGPVLRALVSWGRPLLEAGRGEDAFSPQWLMLALPILFGHVEVADLGPLTAVLEMGGEPVTLEIGETLTSAMGSPAGGGDVRLRGDPEAVFDFLSGRSAGEDGRVVVDGGDEAARRLREFARRAGRA
jgi:DNA-binding HxlR family transcriptional regulator